MIYERYNSKMNFWTFWQRLETNHTYLLPRKSRDYAEFYVKFRQNRADNGVFDENCVFFCKKNHKKEWNLEWKKWMVSVIWNPNSVMNLRDEW